MSTLYRIVFEAVNVEYLQYAAWLSENTPNSAIPEEEWHWVTTKPTEDPWDQYNTLREWSSQGINMVRNARLEKAWVETSQWEEVTDDKPEV